MTQPTAEQLRLARECAESVLGERYQALIGKDTKDKIPELRARICKVRCGEGDHLTEVQSALLAIQATEARMAALEDALRGIEEGTIERPILWTYREDGKPSKHDRCIHDVWMYETCEGCIDAHITKALGKGSE